MAELMAGDWIKVEHSLPDKPEVDQLATLLNLDHDAVVGKLVRFWIWADSQSVDGDALVVTSVFIDRLTYCPGFSVALLKVGWLVRRSGHYSLPNFDRHNSQTAKSRALTRDRMKRSRDADSVTKSSPEIEKSDREELETDLEPEKDKKEETPKPPAGASMSCKEFFDRWNKFVADKPKLISCRKLTDKRERWIRCRLKQPEWLDDFREAVQVLPLGGEGWQPTLDWLVKNGHNVYQIIEGAFDWRIKDDPALKKLEQVRRRRAAAEREAEVERQKQADKQTAPQLRSAIETTLHPPNGSGGANGVSSLLSG